MRRLLEVSALLLCSGRLLDAFSSTSAPRKHLRPLSPIQQREASSSTVFFAAKNDDVCTVQILMSDTGGGHRASANALRDAFDVLFPGKFECDIVDLYTEYGPFWPFDGYVEAYKTMAKYSFLWDITFRIVETDLGKWLSDFVLEIFCFNAFKECLNRPSGSSGKRADMVVSVHPLCQDLPLKILANLDTDGASRDPSGRTTPFVTVVTDLGGASRTWFHSGVDKCFVPSDVLKEKALSLGLSSSQIVQHGLPIRKGFWSQEKPKGSVSTQSVSGFMNLIRKDGGKPSSAPLEQRAQGIRSQLGIDENLPTVLVVGGGDGMGGIVDIAKALGNKLGASGSSPSYQLVVVCGNNEEAKKKLSGTVWGPGVSVIVKGFVNNMDEWMRASDTLVTKAGPGTIAEASICGLPCMLFAFLPGQEEGNVPFVENSGFGKYSGNPKEIADTVSSWLSSPETMKAMKAAALEASRPSATLDIAGDLAEIAFSTKLTKERQLVRVR